MISWLITTVKKKKGSSPAEYLSTLWVGKLSLTKLMIISRHTEMNWLGPSKSFRCKSVSKAACWRQCWGLFENSAFTSPTPDILVTAPTQQLDQSVTIRPQPSPHRTHICSPVTVRTCTTPHFWDNLHSFWDDLKRAFNFFPPLLPTSKTHAYHPT